jgi:predicted ester cyclase
MAMSAAENKALIRRAWEGLNVQDLSGLDACVAPDLVFHSPELEPTMAQIFAAFPDAHYTIEDLLAVDDTVIIRWSFRGTHQGDIYGLAPTGKQVTTKGIEIDRFVDGKLVEAWNEWDVLGFLQQLGGIPAFSPA